MKLTPEYLRTLPMWVVLELSKAGVDEVYDHEHDWNTPWDETPQYRLTSFGGLVRDNNDGTFNLLIMEKGGRLMEYENCYLQSFTSSLTEPIPDDEVVTELPVWNDPTPTKAYKFQVKIKDGEKPPSLINGTWTPKKDPNNFWDTWMKENLK